MVDTSPSEAVHIEAASFHIDDDGLMTQAAFLLAASIWFYKREYGGYAPLLPEEDMESLGLGDWHLDDAEPERLDPYAGEFRELAGGYLGFPDSESFHRDLGGMIWKAYSSRRRHDLAGAVLKGTGSPDPLVRICAIVSAFEMFKVSSRDQILMLTQFDYSESETASAIQSMLLARVLRMALSANNAPPVVSSAAPAAPGLMLIHGTNFPPNRPVWSVPQSGPLFNYIQRFRSDLYGQQDYFRWEGGYGDYAREVAATNLDDWIARRNPRRIDAVAHSHGGNVLMKSTHHTATFGKALLLSCPVHWYQYFPNPGRIGTPVSVRVRLDLVILADRGGQRFPVGCGITERVLNIWFKHSATCEPAIWHKYNIDQYIK